MLRSSASALAVALLTVLGVAVPSTAALPLEGPDTPVRYSAPVDGRVLQSFDPGAGPFGPGHRGVDLDAVPGDLVRAAAAGRVAHAGPVAGTVWVSIDHRDGVRTSYGPLADVRVAVGQTLDRGEVLGRLAPGGHGPGSHDRGLHLGARLHGVYIDPQALLLARASLRGPVDHAAGAPSRPAPGDVPPSTPRLAVPGPARQAAPRKRVRPILQPAAAEPVERLRTVTVDAAAAQPLPSRHGPPSMVGLLHVPTIPHAR